MLGLDESRLLGLVLSGTVTRVTSEDPPTKPCHTQACDEESNAHPEPGRHPLAGEKDHACNLSANPFRVLRALGATRVLVG